MNNYLKYFLIRKSVNYGAKSNWRNWWIVKLIVFLGAILGYTTFFAIARQIIFEDYKWYWTSLMILVSIGLIYDIFKRIKIQVKKWKKN